MYKKSANLVAQMALFGNPLQHTNLSILSSPASKLLL